MEGFIYLHRSMLEWEWYKDANTCRLFLHCLLRANWKPCKWHGISLDPGQFATSLQTLADETGLTVSKARTSLNHLQKTGELTSKSQGRIRIITVKNWDQYQVLDKKMTAKSQQNDVKIATDEEINKKEKINIKNRTFTPPTVEEVREYCLDKGYMDRVNPNKFVDFYESKGWMIGKNKMKDWRAAVRNWASREKAEKKTTKSKFNNFEGRIYDFNALEQEAFGKGNT